MCTIFTFQFFGSVIIFVWNLGFVKMQTNVQKNLQKSENLEYRSNHLNIALGDMALFKKNEYFV